MNRFHRLVGRLRQVMAFSSLVFLSSFLFFLFFLFFIEVSKVDSGVSTLTS